MSKERYFDFSGKELTINDIVKNSQYHKAHFYENGLFKLIETYENSEIVAVIAFVEIEAETKSIFSKYSHLNEIEFNLIQETKGIYSKYLSFNLNKYDIKSEDSIQVFGKDMFPIYENNNLNDSQAHNSLWKYFYFTDINVEFEFEYEEDGKFKKLSIYDVDMICDSDYSTILPNDVGIGKNDFNFNWKGMEYYMNSEPIIPNGEITTHNNVYNSA